MQLTSELIQQIVTLRRGGAKVKELLKRFHIQHAQLSEIFVSHGLNKKEKQKEFQESTDVAIENTIANYRAKKDNKPYWYDESSLASDGNPLKIRFGVWI